MADKESPIEKTAAKPVTGNLVNQDWQTLFGAKARKARSLADAIDFDGGESDYIGLPSSGLSLHPESLKFTVETVSQKVARSGRVETVPSEPRLTKVWLSPRRLIEKQLTNLHLTIAGLSKKSGVSERTIYRMKDGEPIQADFVEPVEKVLELQKGELAKLLPAPTSSEHRSYIARKAGQASGKSRRKSSAGTSS